MQYNFFNPVTCYLALDIVAKSLEKLNKLNKQVNLKYE